MWDVRRGCTRGKTRYWRRLLPFEACAGSQVLRKLSRLALVFLAANSAVMFVVAFGISVGDSVGDVLI